MSIWIVYILEVNNGSLYTGITNNLEARLKKHGEGKGSKYVRAHLPFRLVYTEKASNKSEASIREIAIKKMSHSKKISMIEQKSRSIKMADEKKCGGKRKKCCSDPDKDCECDDKECDDKECDDKECDDKECDDKECDDND